MLRQALLCMQKISGFGPLNVTLDFIEARWDEQPTRHSSALRRQIECASGRQCMEKRYA
jgi:hypothetical protein